jgi:radical SAM superfamily enzyme YgiQ (UPF0313 family)
MKVLLLSPPYVPEYMRNARCDFVSLSATQWYPILLGYCGAWLEKNGHIVKLVDAPAFGLTHHETDIIISEFEPDLLVIYSGLRSEDNDIAFAEMIIDNHGCDAVYVGPFASINPENLLNKSQNIKKVVIGEFEHPVSEIAQSMSPSKIQNLLYKTDNKIKKNTMRPQLDTEQLDAIPFVSQFFKNHLNIKQYKTISEFHPFIDILTGRGCKWGLCTFCLWVNTYIKGQTYNLRSIDNVIEEFKYIESEIPEVRSVMIQDDTFTEDRAYKFCNAYISSNLSLPWSCYARGNMSYDVLKLMKKANCRNLHVGYESADPDILKTIKKGISNNRMTRFTKDAKKAGLRIHGDFAIGFPGETAETVKATIKWAKKLNPHTAQFQLMIPFPGTPFYDMLQEKDWLNKNGEPDYPDFSNQYIRKWAKKAYRCYYLSLQYLWKVICHPYEHFLNRLKTISRAIPAMFWKDWK